MNGLHRDRSLSHGPPGFQHPSHQQRPETIVRLLDMAWTRSILRMLSGGACQRLVRTLCKSCREPYHPNRAEYDILIRSYAGTLRLWASLHGRSGASQAKGVRNATMDTGEEPPSQSSWKDPMRSKRWFRAKP